MFSQDLLPKGEGWMWNVYSMDVRDEHKDFYNLSVMFVLM